MLEEMVGEMRMLYDSESDVLRWERLTPTVPQKLSFGQFPLEWGVRVDIGFSLGEDVSGDGHRRSLLTSLTIQGASLFPLVSGVLNGIVSDNFLSAMFQTIAFVSEQGESGIGIGTYPLVISVCHPENIPSDNKPGEWE